MDNDSHCSSRCDGLLNRNFYSSLDIVSPFNYGTTSVFYLVLLVNKQIINIERKRNIKELGRQVVLENNSRKITHKISNHSRTARKAPLDATMPDILYQ